MVSEEEEENILPSEDAEDMFSKNAEDTSSDDAEDLSFWEIDKYRPHLMGEV